MTFDATSTPLKWFVDYLTQSAYGYPRCMCVFFWLSTHISLISICSLPSTKRHTVYCRWFHHIMKTESLIGPALEPMLMSVSITEGDRCECLNESPWPKLGLGVREYIFHNNVNIISMSFFPSSFDEFHESSSICFMYDFLLNYS